MKIQINDDWNLKYTLVVLAVSISLNIISLGILYLNRKRPIEPVKPNQFPTSEQFRNKKDGEIFFEGTGFGPNKFTNSKIGGVK